MLKRLRKNKKKGFTLMELIVNMSVMGLIIVIVTTLTTSSLNSFNRQQDKLDAIAVADTILSTIKAKTQKIYNVKLDTYFYEKFLQEEKDGEMVDSNIAIDQTNDNVIDYMCRDEDGHQLPMCEHEVKNFSGICVLPDNRDIINEDKISNDAKRRGKVYLIKQSTPTNPVVFYPEKQMYIKGQNGEDIAYGEPVKGYLENCKVEKLIDDELYRGYEVDVRFKYLQKSNIVPDATPSEGGSASAQADEDVDVEITDTFLKDCFRVEITVYKGTKKMYSTKDTITFLQPNFKMLSPRKDASLTEYKNVLMFR